MVRTRTTASKAETTLKTISSMNETGKVSLFHLNTDDDDFHKNFNLNVSFFSLFNNDLFFPTIDMPFLINFALCIFLVATKSMGWGLY